MFETLTEQIQQGKNAYRLLNDTEKEEAKQEFIATAKNNFLKKRADRQNYEQLGNNIDFLLFLREKYRQSRK